MSTGDRFERAVSIMARLRAPGGCPWDREQTFDSIKPYTLEETYEVFAAWDDGLTESQNLKATLSGRYPTAGWEREVESTLLRRLRHVELIRPLIALAKGGMSVADDLATGLLFLMLSILLFIIFIILLFILILLVFPLFQREILQFGNASVNSFTSFFVKVALKKSAIVQ